MLNLGEYRQKSDRLADHLPWAALVAPGVILNKDGSFQRSFRFRGPDLESATQSELGRGLRPRQQRDAAVRLGMGDILSKRSGFGRRDIPCPTFPDDATWLVDEERRAQFESGGAVADAGKRANAPAFRDGLLSDFAVYAAGGQCRQCRARPHRDARRQEQAGLAL